MVNLFGNIIPFMPIGLLAPLVVRSISWQKALVLEVVTGLTFEVMETGQHLLSQAYTLTRAISVFTTRV